MARVLVSRKETQKARTFYEGFLKSYPRASLMRFGERPGRRQKRFDERLKEDSLLCLDIPERLAGKGDAVTAVRAHDR